ncbi:MAG: rod shape-determining protein RodA [Spirochaetales bacterium]|nr:rod shape-determining protein RodA [Leptospiraceae bacterium]MCP5481982.1 rod shape-determining protein RodA [Spirochaetales bacterium]MCP5486463.1 rod shape-determining protein RodA [Spirochaetales bacterium]
MEKRLRIDILLVACILFVVLAGIFTLYTQESVTDDSSGKWIKQAVFFAIGLIMMFAIRKLNYNLLASYALPIYAFGIFLLLITLIPGIGTRVKGAQSWIRFGEYGFQTSEVAKLATIILLARYLELKERELDRIPSLLIPFGIAVLPMILIVVQPDFGGAFSFAPVLMSMLFIAGADVYHIGSVLVFFGVSFSIPLYLEYYKITLVTPLLEHLAELQKTDLIPAVRILQYDIWKFLDGGIIPDTVSETDLPYLRNVLGNENLIESLRDAAEAVRYESGGFILLVLQNINLLLILGLLLALVALALFVVRVTQGTSMEHLRRYYIPVGVLGISLLAAVTVYTFVPFRPHQVARVTAFVNPDQFPRDLAYQIRASKAAIGSGQLTGRGFFEGDMTMGHVPLVPESSTDFIFTSWSERTGFLGSVFLLLALFAIPLRGLLISFEARDRFGSLLAAGITFLLFYHMALNTGIALGLLPVTGLPLSFMSYGGSHLLTCMMAAGILLSIYRRRFAN